MACAITRSRSGVWRFSAPTTALVRSSAVWSLVTPSMAISSSPVSPVSSEQSAFCRLSWNVRPIAMASPTDFMAVVRSGLAPGNFSKANRGILVTT